MRLLWFVGGTIAGIIATNKARNAAYRLSMPGLVDQANTLRLGAQAFNAELRDGMVEKESEFRHQLMAPHQPHRELEPKSTVEHRHEPPHDSKERH